jgi:DNA-3-methyladenine glycosylase II
MADLIAAHPTLDPDIVLDGWPTALWDALVFNVVEQQLSVAATRAIVGRLEALQDGRLPTPAELLATDSRALRWIGLSRAKAAYVRDLAERLFDGWLGPGPATESRRRSRPDRADAGQGCRAIHRRRCLDVRPAPT